MYERVAGIDMVVNPRGCSLGCSSPSSGLVHLGTRRQPELRRERP
jgi:hypothetical protein